MTQDFLVPERELIPSYIIKEQSRECEISDDPTPNTVLPKGRCMATDQPTRDTDGCLTGFDERTLSLQHQNLQDGMLTPLRPEFGSYMLRFTPERSR